MVKYTQDILGQKKTATKFINMEGKAYVKYDSQKYSEAHTRKVQE